MKMPEKYEAEYMVIRLINHLTSSIGTVSNFDLLLDRLKAADIEKSDNNMGRLLRVATSRGRLAEVAILLKAGADINFQNESSLETPLISAVLADDLQMTSLLLSEGANPNIGDSIGLTPLHLVVNAKTYFYEMAVLLLNAGASPNMRDINGTKPLDLAPASTYPALYNLLRTAEETADLAVTAAVSAINLNTDALKPRSRWRI